MMKNNTLLAGLLLLTLSAFCGCLSLDANLLDPG